MNTKLLQQLCLQHAVAGDTEEILSFIEKYLQGQKIKTVRNGYGVLLAGNIESPKVIITAHADEVGFRVIKKLENGTFLIKSSGLVSAVMLNNTPVYVQTEAGKLAGVVYPRKELGNNKPEDYSEIFLDVIEPEKVHVGDFGSYERSFSESKNKIIATGLDNKIGVLMLLEFIIEHKDFLKTNALAFVTEEETTYDCIAGVGFQVQPEFAIVVDMIPNHQVQNEVNIMPESGKGPAVLQSMYKYHLHTEWRKILKKIKIPYQEVYAEIDFAPEPQQMHRNGKTKGLNLLIPMLGWHNIGYSMQIGDYQKGLNLLESLITNVN